MFSQMEKIMAFSFQVGVSAKRTGEGRDAIEKKVLKNPQ